MPVCQVFTNTHTHVHLHALAHTNTHIPTRARARIDTHTNTHIHTQTHTYSHKLTHTPTHTHTQTHTHTHTLTQIHTQVVRPGEAHSLRVRRAAAAKAQAASAGTSIFRSITSMLGGSMSENLDYQSHEGGCSQHYVLSMYVPVCFVRMVGALVRELGPP